MANAVSERREHGQDPEVIFVDLVRSQALLDAEERHAPRLSGADIERAGAITDETARRLWRTARIATRVVLERMTGESLRGIPFRIEAGGRPVLPQGQPHFSVSHSGGAALIAIARDMPVGVDLERKDRALRMSADRRLRIVGASERLGPGPLLSGDGDDGDVLVAWVRLEAVAKALGTGIGRLLTEEGVIGGRGPTGAQGAERGLDVRSLAVGNAYVAAIAAPRLPEDLNVRVFPIESLDGFLQS
jgi:4'-phosphopantetheinyl transferase